MLVSTHWCKNKDLGNQDRDFFYLKEQHDPTYCYREELMSNLNKCQEENLKF